MGASEPVTVVVERENGEKEQNLQKEETIGVGVKDLEKGHEVDIMMSTCVEEEQDNPTNQIHHISKMQTLSSTNPLRLVIDSATRSVSVSPPSQPPHITPSPIQHQPRSTPTPQQSVITLNSRAYTNRISLFLFLSHMVIAVGLVGFLLYKGIQGLLQSGPTQRKEKSLLQEFLPQVEAASLLSISLAFSWQKAVRLWPQYIVHFILWSSFVMSMAAGVLLICYEKPATYALGVPLILFALGNSLYACWAGRRAKFCSKVLAKSLAPVPIFADLNQPTYWMLAVGFMWMSLWVLAVIGALNFYLTPLVVGLLVLSLAWTTEVMRNVANLTVSRVIALYYLRGMQSSTQFCFQRALSMNLGSACLGSLFVPAIEALRIVARALNLLEGEDEFMFCCAPCCLRIMDSIFRYGNGWAYVQIATYGKSFVRASQDTWELFERQEMETIVDSDMSSAVFFLSGVCSGSICTIVVAAWTAKVHENYIATISLLAFFVGYLMTRISMALPQACMSCYYVCYAENPNNRLFDKTIPDRLNLIKSEREMVVPTPRGPRKYTR